MNDIFFQDDGDKFYYTMDFSTHNSILAGDTVTGTPTVTSEIRGGLTSNLLIEEITASGLYVGMWISSGTAYTTYKIEVTAQFQNYKGIIESDGFLRIGD